MITLRGIEKHYGSLHVLKHIDIDINPNEILAIIGPSGAGKSTLLQIAGTLEKPDYGSILYNDTELTKLNDRRLSAFRNANIGFIFQFHRLLPEFTALENVMMPALIGGTPMRKARIRAMELLERLHLEQRAKHRPAQMSGGECQRVAVARALVNNPEVVFADEPTGSLDTENKDEVQQLIAELNRDLGQTFVIVTHDDSLASIAGRIIRLVDGRIENEVCQCIN